MARLVLIGSVKFTGAGAIVAQSGICASITHNGAGDNSIVLVDELAGAECIAKVTTSRAVAASGNTAWGLVHVSNTEKRLTSAVEAAVGGASVLANTDGEIKFYRITP